MSDAFIGIDEPTTIDKRADTEQLTVSATTVMRERIQLAGSVDVEIADIHNAQPTGAEYAPFNRPVGLTASGALGAAEAAVTIGAHGMSTVHFEIDTGTLVGTVSFEATLDDTNWFAIDGVILSTGLIAQTVNSFATRGLLVAAGYSQVRMRVSAYTSGTSNARLEASPGNNTIRVPEIGRADEAEAAGNGSLIAIQKRIRTLLNGGLPAALVSGRLDVNVGNNPVLGAGTNNIGDVDIVSFPDNEPFNVAQWGGVAPTAAAALADNLANPTAPHVGSYMLAFDGATWDRVRIGSEAGSILVDLGANNDVTIASVTPDLMLGTDFSDVLGTATLITTTQADNLANTLDTLNVSALLYGFDGTTWDRLRGDATDGLLVNLGANNDVTIASVTPDLMLGTDFSNVLGSASLVSNAAIQVTGDEAHDAADAGNPIKIGGYASLNEPSAVSGDADRVNAWFDRFGRLVVVGGHANPESPVNANHTASGDNTTIAAPGAGVSLHIVKASVHNSGASPITVALRDGTAGTIRWRAELAADGGGSLINFGERGWKLTANTLLATNLSAAGDVQVNITEHYIAA